MACATQQNRSVNITQACAPTGKRDSHFWLVHLSPLVLGRRSERKSCRAFRLRKRQTIVDACRHFDRLKLRPVINCRRGSPLCVLCVFLCCFAFLLRYRVAGDPGGGGWVVWEIQFTDSGGTDGTDLASEIRPGQEASVLKPGVIEFY
ncbi:hypothetical protein RRG08_006951 [Elysia crispata]|uniref:Uncharacterized protein n=1 Tax=Elysia crispata TaxID=231223 RepID=A0AAE0XQW1_9GAST|nr:hypothetical protein RRG08_006951 [Elysia crispata]